MPVLSDFIRIAGATQREIVLGDRDHELHTRRNFMSRLVERFQPEKATRQHREVSQQFVNALREALDAPADAQAVFRLAPGMSADQKDILLSQVTELLESQLQGRRRLTAADIRAAVASVEEKSHVLSFVNDALHLRDEAEALLSHLGKDPENPERVGLGGALLRAVESGQDLTPTGLRYLERESVKVADCIGRLRDALHAENTRAARQHLVSETRRVYTELDPALAEELREAHEQLLNTLDGGLVYLSELEDNLWLYQARIANALEVHAVGEESGSVTEQGAADTVAHTPTTIPTQAASAPEGLAAQSTPSSGALVDERDTFFDDDFDRDRDRMDDEPPEVQPHEVAAEVDSLVDSAAAAGWEPFPALDDADAWSVRSEPEVSPQQPRLDAMGRLFGDSSSRTGEYERFLAKRDSMLEQGNPAAHALTDDQHFALYAYTMNEFSDMNRALRDAAAGGAGSSRVHNLIRSATEGLTALRDAGLTHQGFTYRGVRDYAALRNQAEGSVFTSQAFSSTTRRSEVARERFALANEPNTASSTVLRQFGNQGASVAQISQQEEAAEQPGDRVEDEVLLPPGVDHRVLLNVDHRVAQGTAREKVITDIVTEQANLPPSSGRAGYFESLLDRDPAQSRAQPDPRRVQVAAGSADDLELERLRRESRAQPSVQARASALREERVRPENVVRLDQWTVVRGKTAGSNPGAVYRDTQGQEWLVKGNRVAEAGQVSERENADRARNEVLASKLLQAAGVDVPEMQLVDLQDKHGKGLGVASRWVTGQLEPVNPANLTHVRLMNEQFAAHAWLGNFDALGEDMANTLIQDGARAVHVDPGGALLFRAQGLAKSGANGVRFGLLNTEAPEWTSMQRTTYGQRQVFAPAAGAQAKLTGAQRLAGVSNAQIRNLVQEFGPGEAPERRRLAANLIARRDAVLRRAGVEGWAIGTRPERGVPGVDAGDVEAFNRLSKVGASVISSAATTSADAQSAYIKP